MTSQPYLVGEAVTMYSHQPESSHFSITVQKRDYIS